MIFSLGGENKTKSEAMLELILMQDPYFEHKDKEGLTAINFAMKYKREAAEILLEEARDFREIHEKDNDGMAPIHYAASYGSLELWYNLKRKGAETRLKALRWDVFDFFAAAHSNLAVVEDLIAISRWSFDLGKFLAEDYSIGVKKLIIEYTALENLYNGIDERNLLQKYTLDGSIELLAALHARGVNFERPQEQGLRALHYAVRERKIAIARWLLEHGAKAYVKNNSKIRPFQLINCEESSAWDGVRSEVIKEWEELLNFTPEMVLNLFLNVQLTNKKTDFLGKKVIYPLKEY